jgi:hypothetical protein
MVEILTADDLSNDNFYPGEAHTVRGDEHSQGAATINPQAKQTKCDRLERLVDEFLGSGGAITICPPGQAAQIPIWCVQAITGIFWSVSEQRPKSTALV